MSSKASARLPSPIQRCTSRMPGLSTIMPPLGSRTSSRRVVVCRPAPSAPTLAGREARVVADERVDERRLADAGRPEEHARRHPAKQRARTASSPTPARADTRSTGTSPPTSGELCRHGVRLGLEIGLREQRRPGARRSRPRARGSARGAGGRAPARAPGRRGRRRRSRRSPARARRPTRARALRGARSSSGAEARRRWRPSRVERDPVADDREARSRSDRSPEPARDPAPLLPVGCEHVVLAAMLHRDASGRVPLLGVRLERGAPAVVPAERREIRHGRIVSEPTGGPGGTRPPGPPGSLHARER